MLCKQFLEILNNDEIFLIFASIRLTLVHLFFVLLSVFLWSIFFWASFASLHIYPRFVCLPRDYIFAHSLDMMIPSWFILYYCVTDFSSVLLCNYEYLLLCMVSKFATHKLVLFKLPSKYLLLRYWCSF